MKVKIMLRRGLVAPKRTLSNNYSRKWFFSSGRWFFFFFSSGRTKRALTLPIEDVTLLLPLYLPLNTHDDDDHDDDHGDVIT